MKKVDDNLEKLTYSNRRLEATEACEEHASVQGYILDKDSEVIVRVRGRSNLELKCKFKCYNKLYGTLILDCEDGEYFIRLSNIIYIKKPK